MENSGASSTVALRVFGWQPGKPQFVLYRRKVGGMFRV
jgi:hypothetical protein